MLLLSLSTPSHRIKGELKKKAHSEAYIKAYMRHITKSMHFKKIIILL